MGDLSFSMASNIFLLLLSFVIHFAPEIVTAQQRNNTGIISLGSSLSPTNGIYNSSWRSPSGRFAFGFYPQGNGFIIAVWFTRIPEKIVVWSLIQDDKQRLQVVVSSNATLILNKEGWLILRDERGEEKNIFSNPAASAAMLDSGNFVLYNSTSQIIWQTFDSPTNTILQGQRLSNGKELVSSVSRIEGRFYLRMQEDGHLVLYSVQYEAKVSDSYWASGTVGQGPTVTLNLDGNGHLYLINGTGAYKRNFTNGWSSPNNGTVWFYRMTLDDDGLFRVYSHSLDQNGSWSVRWSLPINKCDVKGQCGLNAYCVLMDQDFDCLCIPQSDFINQSEKTTGCERKFFNQCRNNTSKEEMSLVMVSIENTSWDEDPYSTLPSTTEDDCKNACLEDCNCEVVRFNANDDCTKQRLPLKYGKRQEDSTKTFIKINRNQINGEGPNTYTQTGKKKSLPRYVLVISVAFFSCSMAFSAVSGFLLRKSSKNSRYKKIVTESSLTEQVSLRSFTYNELEQATDGFNEEVGRGAFGTVFKGTLPNSDQKIAVKRLEKNLVDEGKEREFQNEMQVIGKTHHRNLVNLLGYCQSGSNYRLLVYEYMSEGSLADFLFNSDPQKRPDWEERLRIALDIARGILYLHEECETQIIHCDIKLQNILMDEKGHVKIGDFGLAKLLKPDQTKTFTGIRGTRGYVAPEWHRNLPVTVKADVYSFGIVLLEIVCYRRKLDMNLSEDEVILANWVYECFESGEICKLVSREDHHQVDMKRFERVVRVALWCIQDEPSLRPSMKKVVLMLEGTIEIPTPPSPSSFFSTI